jgi:hypothetical protein
MGLLDDAMYRKCGREEEPSYHIHSMPCFGWQRTQIFSSAWLEPTDIRRASTKNILVLGLRKGSLDGPLQDQGLILASAMI